MTILERCKERIGAEFSETRLGGLGWLVLLAILALGFGLRLRLLFGDAAQLAATQVPDAAAFSYVVAQNIAQGLGLTWVKDLVATGFQPLWMLFILPVFTFFSGLAAVKAVLAICLALTLVAAILLFRLARRLTGRNDAALFALLFYYLSPFLLMESVNGLETALADLMGLLLLGALLRMRDGVAAFRPWLIGLLAGLLLLARMDAVFLAGLATAWSAWALAEEGRRFRALLLSGVVASAIVAPWLILCWQLGGSPMPGSGAAYAFVLHENFAAEHPGFWPFLAHSLDRLRLGIEYGLETAQPYFRGSVGGAWVMLGLLFGAAWLVWHARVRPVSATAKRRAGFVFVPLLAALIMLGVHGGLCWYSRGWTVMPFLTALSLLYAAALGVWLDGAKRGRAWLLPLALVFTLMALSETRGQAARGFYPWQVEMVKTGEWLKTAAIEPGPLAGFNVGWITYLSGREVHELGGVVNTAAYPYLREHDLEGYLKQHQIRYLVDYAYSITDEYRFFFGESLPLRLEELARVDLNVAPWLSNYVSLYVYRPDRPKQSDDWPLLFDFGGEHDRFALDGFYPPERLDGGVTQRISKGPRSLVGMYLARGNERPIKLTLRLAPFIPAGQTPDTLKIGLELNGSSVGELAVERARAEFIEVSRVLPVHALRRGYNRLVLSYGDTLTPARSFDLRAIEESPLRDYKDIAVAYDWLKLEATVEKPEAP